MSIQRNESGIWSEGFGGLHLVARAGSPPDDFDPGIEFDRGFGHIFLNAMGQTMFEANLRGPGITELNDRGLWAEDLTGVLKPRSTRRRHD